MIAQGCSFAQYERPIILQYESPIFLLIHFGISTVATENQVSGRLHPVATRIKMFSRAIKAIKLSGKSGFNNYLGNLSKSSHRGVPTRDEARKAFVAAQKAEHIWQGLKACNTKNTNQAKKVSRGKIPPICIVSAKIFLHLLVISRLRCKCRPEV